MKSSYVVWIGFVVLALAGGFYLFSRSNNSGGTTVETTNTTEATSTTAPIMPTDAPSPMIVVLNSQNMSGQNGTATFSENADRKAVVKLSLVGGNFVQPQPAHIHIGECPKPGAVKYPLTNVVDGLSETVLPVSWAQLVDSDTKLALNVHKSAAESSVYTACGDLPVEITATTSTTPAATGTMGY